jgi:hypothetical protein
MSSPTSFLALHAGNDENGKSDSDEMRTTASWSSGAWYSDSREAVCSQKSRGWHWRGDCPDSQINVSPLLRKPNWLVLTPALPAPSRIGIIPSGQVCPMRSPKTCSGSHVHSWHCPCQMTHDTNVPQAFHTSRTIVVACLDIQILIRESEMSGRLSAHGLRTSDKLRPWPSKIRRVLMSQPIDSRQRTIYSERMERQWSLKI